MNRIISRELIIIATIFIFFAIAIAGIGLLFYQGLAALDNELGIDNDLVFFVPKDQQRESIIELLQNIEKDLQTADVVSDAELESLDAISDLLELDDEFDDLDAFLELE